MEKEGACGINKTDEILNSLRELYRKDIRHRITIAKYANNFKEQHVFLAKEFRFLVQRLNRHNISFDNNLFRSVLVEPLLSVELVPQTCWFSNVRDHVDKKTWDFLRKTTYKNAEHRCEICDGRGEQWPVECHEMWYYDDKNRIQMLQGLIALCPKCHEVKHIGLTGLRGKEKEAKIHLAKINYWNEEETEQYLRKVWDTWQERSRYEWKLDLGWLEERGIVVQSQR